MKQYSFFPTNTERSLNDRRNYPIRLFSEVHRHQKNNLHFYLNSQYQRSKKLINVNPKQRQLSKIELVGLIDKSLPLLPKLNQFEVSKNNMNAHRLPFILNTKFIGLTLFSFDFDSIGRTVSIGQSRLNLWTWNY